MDNFESTFLRWICLFDKFKDNEYSRLGNKLEDKDKIIQLLKDEIKEYFKPNTSPENNKTDNTLIIKKLNRDKIDLEMNCNELKQQIIELDKKHKELNGNFETKTSDYNKLILMFDNIESENIMLKKNLKLFEETIQAKDTEITSLKDQLCNKPITNNQTNISGQESNSMPSSILFNELSCLELEEITHDKEKYRHKYKSIKKELSNTEIHVEELNEKLNELETQKKYLKMELDVCNLQHENSVQKLKVARIRLQEFEGQNNNLQEEVEILNFCTLEQLHKINILTSEKNNFVNETNMLKEQFSHKQSEMNEQIKLKNDLIKDIYQKINNLKNMKVELESLLKKEKKII
ncbi:paramyosin-like [Rhopalosiphum padi]|uniref:paramyosin-like n=1 Tax=Rhopalosiphum padi TaxID=40932 RepID=UPI00298D7F3F|nr:paramyosin-like [Rhopalosiphum padi]XP_060846482.1 paramyosin-like [Rhopalosiphum padi]